VPVPRPAAGPATSRRTTVVGALAGLLAVTGCDLDDLDPRGAEAEPDAPPTEQSVDADAELVDRALTRITSADTVLEELVRQHPRLRRELRPLREMHAAHAEVLGGFLDRATISGPFELPQARRLVRRTETGLQRHLTQAAVRAESGGLAKLLASMAAGVAQNMAVLG
jgi:hypothetical protein